jgi:hypothetical protein
VIKESDSPVWVPGTYKPPPGATNDSGDLLEAMRASGEAFTARQAGQESRGQDLMNEARDVLGSAGIRLVLALLKADRIPCPPLAIVASVPVRAAPPRSGLAALRCAPTA